MKISNPIRSLRALTERILFPENTYCAICKKLLFSGNEPVCRDCSPTINSFDRSLCSKDGAEMKSNDFFYQEYSELNKIFSSSYCHCRYSDAAQSLVLEFKFKRYKEAAVYAASLMARRMKQIGFLEGIDEIVCIPATEEKKAARGYNQADIIASKIAKEANVVYSGDILLLKRKPGDQIGKSREERSRNVEDLFDIPESFTVSGKHILITDDVVTTGATLKECGKLLNENGAKAVSFAAFAAARL